MKFRLGTGLARIIPFYNYQRHDEPIITNKILYIFGIVGIAKIAVLLLMM